jgi:hypothetical protein
MANLFQTSPLDKVESYLGNRSVPFVRVDDTTIRIPAYGNQNEEVELLLQWEPEDSVLIICADGGIKVSALQSVEVLQYLNELNSTLLTFTFFINSQQDTIQCRWAHIMTEEMFSDYVMETLLDDVREGFLVFGVPVLAIIDDGGTSLDALKELKATQETEGDLSV